MVSRLIRLRRNFFVENTVTITLQSVFFFNFLKGNENSLIAVQKFIHRMDCYHLTLSINKIFALCLVGSIHITDCVDRIPINDSNNVFITHKVKFLDNLLDDKFSSDDQINFIWYKIYRLMFVCDYSFQ